MKPRIARLNKAGAALLTVVLSGALVTAAAGAFIGTPEQGTAAPGAHEFRVVDGTTSCSRCHGGTYPHFIHVGQSCTTCHAGGHVATASTCLDCHSGHDGPVPLALCTTCHEDGGGSLIIPTVDHQTKVDATQCVNCHGTGSTTTTTTVPPSSTTVPPSSTTVPPSSTTVPPSSTTVPPSSTTVPPSSTTTTLPPTTTTTTTLPPTTTTTVPPTTTTLPPGPQPPVADAGNSRNAGVGELRTFDGSGSYDLDGTIVSYFWDFGDGTTATGAVVSHSYATVGTYTVVLTVTDNDGLTGVDAAIVKVK